MNLRFPCMALGLCALLACSHRSLNTSISGHRTENLRAEAQKVEGGWRVTLQLPLGEWQVKTPNEQQVVQVIPGTPFSVAQWTVDSERWAKARPLDLMLEGGGFQIPMTVNYRRDLPRWVQAVLVDVAGGGHGFPVYVPEKKD